MTARRYKVTLAGGIPVPVDKLVDGGAVGTVRRLLDREGKQVFVRSDLPGFVRFDLHEGEIRAWAYPSAGHTLPARPGEITWADELINQVKGSS